MCDCNLREGMHWWVDTNITPIIYQLAETPEKAKHNLKSWAAKILRNGHFHLELISVAAKILSTKILNMQSICSSSSLSDSFHCMV